LILDYLDGRCTPEEKARIQLQLFDPHSAESIALSHIRDVTSFAASEEMNDISRDALNEWLSASPVEMEEMRNLLPKCLQAPALFRRHRHLTSVNGDSKACG
jgi:hypothetical protein